jgi:hypothetical protein
VVRALAEEAIRGAGYLPVRLQKERMDWGLGSGEQRTVSYLLDDRSANREAGDDARIRRRERLTTAVPRCISRRGLSWHGR